jgi:hypothetical protein
MQELAKLRSSRQQLELSHSVLQERLITMEEDAAAARDAQAVAAAERTYPPASAQDHVEQGERPSAQMYRRLATSSSWAARQMAAIEGE